MLVNLRVKVCKTDSGNENYLELILDFNLIYGNRNFVNKVSLENLKWLNLLMYRIIYNVIIFLFCFVVYVNILFCDISLNKFFFLHCFFKSGQVRLGLSVNNKSIYLHLI